MKNTREAKLRQARKAQEVLDHARGYKPIHPWLYCLLNTNGLIVDQSYVPGLIKKRIRQRQKDNAGTTFRLVRYRWTPEVRK